jgi:protein phosphatase
MREYVYIPVMLTIEQIDAAMRTDQGQVRGHNEDFIDYREPSNLEELQRDGFLYIVADGVGGAVAGEVASRVATERTLYHYLNNSDEGDWGKRIQQAMFAANKDLRELVFEQMIGSRMATTMVAAVLHDYMTTIANVGDSRGYHWKNGVLRQITKDQSLVAKLVEEGAITEEEAINHPRRNVILHSLGSENEPQIDIYEVGLSPGEILFLCSDGLTRHVSDAEIEKIIAEQDPDKAAETLINLANERGGEDNISAAVIRIGEQPAADEAPSPVPMVVPGDQPLAIEAKASRLLGIYTAILCIVLVVLIILIWLPIST